MLQKLINYFKKLNDPIHSCEVYKSKESCAHVDGFLCDMKTCKYLHSCREQLFQGIQDSKKVTLEEAHKLFKK